MASLYFHVPTIPYVKVMNSICYISISNKENSNNLASSSSGSDILGPSSFCKQSIKRKFIEKEADDHYTTSLQRVGPHLSLQSSSRSPSPCSIPNSVFKDTNSSKRAHYSAIEYKGSEEIQVSPLHDGEKIISTQFSLHNDHHIVDNIIPTSDTCRDIHCLSYKHTPVSTDDDQIMVSVVPNDYTP